MSAFNNRGAAWRVRGHYHRAISDYNEAIRLNPQLGSALGRRR